MKKSIIIPAVLMPAIATAAFCIYNGAIGLNLLWAAIPTIMMGLGIPAAAKAVTSGTKCSFRVYMSMIIIPYIIVCLSSLFGIMPLTTIAVFLTLAVAIGCSETMHKSFNGNASMVITDLQTRTATLNIMFCTILTLSLLIGKFI